jgi:hypothetical protein
MIDFSFWSMTTMYNNIGQLLIDIVVSAAVLAVVGLVIVLTWGKEKAS